MEAGATRVLFWGGRSDGCQYDYRPEWPDTVSGRKKMILYEVVFSALIAYLEDWCHIKCIIVVITDAMVPNGGSVSVTTIVFLYLLYPCSLYVHINYNHIWFGARSHLAISGRTPSTIVLTMLIAIWKHFKTHVVVSYNINHHKQRNECEISRQSWKLNIYLIPQYSWNILHMFYLELEKIITVQSNLDSWETAIFETERACHSSSSVDCWVHS